MQAHQLDQLEDLRLRAAEAKRAATGPEPPRDHRQIKHQRRVGEHELGEVDDDVVLGCDRADEGLAPRALGGPVLVPTAPEYGRFVIEVDDAGKPSETCGVLTSSEGLVLHFPAMVNVDDVTEALRDVIDPELGLDFVELGLIYDVEVDESGAVSVTYTLTSPGCPIGPQVSEQIAEFVGELDGVRDVQSTMTFSPPWTPERMSEDAKFALGF
jgi:metal-sulfur cluster biosynthetic enzyme